MDYPSLKSYWHDNAGNITSAFQEGRASFLPFLLPELALEFSTPKVLQILSGRFGRGLIQDALDPRQAVPSPLAGLRTTNWIKRTNMVGINVRTIQNFWNVIKYMLTVPEAQQSVHLLPIWEPGVVASLYGMASWNINPEFFSQELYEQYPQLDTVEKQLKVVVNLLHATGRTVGMDVIPHTDRYSEIVLGNPRHFEWLQRRDDKITSHRANLHEDVELAVFRFLKEQGPAQDGIDLPADAETFFSEEYPESARLELLFGSPADYGRRAQRRGWLVQSLYKDGFEPVPATMGPPYRGLEVDTSEKSRTVDDEGRIWREYKISKPQKMSRVFGPLARYKLYERLNDNKNWEIDFSRPRPATWEYACRHFYQIQQEYNFDFMRGDMSHVQMRPEGVPIEADNYYDLHKAVRAHIRKAKPYFGYFAETFLVGPGFIAYGNEVDHLEQADADSTLGDLQSMVAGSPEFMQHFRWYLDILKTRSFAPNFTIMTGDKDDPRFDEFYLTGNEARLFTALFLTDMPSYMALGFECRDPHPTAAPNEHYTKLYVFRISSGEKATRGPYVFGKNARLYHRLSALRQAAEQILPQIVSADTHWLLPPDATAATRVIAWTQSPHPRFLFVVNLDGSEAAVNIKIPRLRDREKLPPPHLHFSTHKEGGQRATLPFNDKQYQISRLEAGECRIYSWGQ
ncbi:MAG: hypothetical protein KDD19_14120 [Phaeodactylibacter sp.]|nr:hypothetical protein [Phaeodactylibacter sp.]MCB9051901.1 hypothetical protein [Lewinellaceae bacterium]